jgi:formylglycine-generating enzyme required for sulfatase activity
MIILLAALYVIVSISIAGCGGEIETIVNITEPANNISTEKNTIHILGKVENTDTTMAKVTVNGKEQQTDIVNGSFDVIITLIDGNNIIKVSVDGIIAQVNITKTNPDGNKIIGKDEAPMVLIPAGDFQMGDSFNEGSSDQRPVHTVYLDAFHIDIYEVTNSQYKKFRDATGYKAPDYWTYLDFNTPNQPVVGVSWYDAKAYAEWAGERLPTEAEWEKAARGSLVGKRYPWGDTLTHDKVNYDRTGGKDIWDGTSPVGSFPPNGYGLYDMCGNVEEWCADWYGDEYYTNSPRSNPMGLNIEPGYISYCVLRGGLWRSWAGSLTVAWRGHELPSDSSNSIGFRCVQDVPK